MDFAHPKRACLRKVYSTPLYHLPQQPDSQVNSERKWPDAHLCRFDSLVFAVLGFFRDVGLDGGVSASGV